MLSYLRKFRGDEKMDYGFKGVVIIFYRGRGNVEVDEDIVFD